MSKTARIFGTIALWGATLVETLTMAIAGSAKFAASGFWAKLFLGWGYPVWFCYAVGLAELAGALALLVPRVACYAAGLLSIVMMGALGTLITHPGSMSWRTPLAHLVILAGIAAARRPATQ